MGRSRIGEKMFRRGLWGESQRDGSSRQGEEEGEGSKGRVDGAGGGGEGSSKIGVEDLWGDAKNDSELGTGVPGKEEEDTGEEIGE
ncbi:hypothetical protein EAG_03198 [Camponotus floridanus]|uniref:Uncharacterized protein n=1 Tax=Camponotus floridanus TaxID=104421 RepID=E2AL38_CAMFO|nr:hypothetical protein EAG_03198 [Camponotus floridanus]